MKLKIFWQEQCPSCPPAKELGKQLSDDGYNVEFHDIKTPDGLAEAVMHDIMATPSLVITDNSNSVIQTWLSQVPKMEDIKTHFTKDDK